MWLHMENISIGNKLRSRIIKWIELYDKMEMPSLFMRMCKKYPNHRLKIYSIFIFKEVMIFALFIYLIMFVSKICDPYKICEGYYDFVMNTFNITNLNFTDVNISDLFKNISVEELLK